MGSLKAGAEGRKAARLAQTLEPPDVFASFFPRVLPILSIDEERAA